MKNKKIGASIIICFIVITMLNNIFAEEYIYTKEEYQTVAQTPVFNFQSVAQILVEPKSGKIIYENNADEKLLPASVTKIMTLLLTMEAVDSGKIKLEDEVTCSAYASKMGGSQIWFKENEKLSVKDCLKAVCVVSANDVAMALAEHIGGSEENFVQMMNEKAQNLNMQNTHFLNPHGIDEEGHYTSARDISIMSMELINNHPKILEYTGIWMDTLRNGTFGLTNTNKLIRFYNGANGIKTGSTSQALFNVSASATRNNMTLIAVIMKAPTSDIRNEEAKKLLDYGFSNFQNIVLIKKGESLGKIKVEKANINEIEIFQGEDLNYLGLKGESKNITKEITLIDKLKAPVNKNYKIGEIVFKKENEVVLTKDIKLSSEIEKIKYIEMLKNIIIKEFVF